VEPVFGYILDNIGYITLNTLATVIHADEIGVIILSLSGQNLPVGESLWRASQVPFPDPGGLVSVIGQILDKSMLRAVESAADIIAESVFVTVATGQQNRTAWSADGVRYIGLIEAHTFFGNTIYCWCVGVFTAIGANGLIRMVVRNNNYYVGSLF